MTVTYSVDRRPSVEDLADLYRRSTLAARRPVDDEIFTAMIESADLLVTAWADDQLVGVARTLTDWLYVAYLADLAVDEAWQRQGLGRGLLHTTQAQLGPECMIVLLAAPAAADYYARVGFEQHPRAWILPPGKGIV